MRRGDAFCTCVRAIIYGVETATEHAVNGCEMPKIGVESCHEVRKTESDSAIGQKCRGGEEERGRSAGGARRMCISKSKTRQPLSVLADWPDAPSGKESPLT